MLRFLLPLLMLFPSIALAVPNIVIIHIGDDIHPSAVGDYRANTHPEAGNSNWTLTALDTMATQGVRFNSFYTPMVCSPSRAELFGFGRVGSVSNPFGKIIRGSIPARTSLRLPVGSETIINVFQRAGYQVAGFGKLHLGTGENNLFAKQLGFDYYEAMLTHNPGNGAKCVELRANVTNGWGHNYWCKHDLDGNFEIVGVGTSADDASNRYTNKIIEEAVTTYITSLTLATDKRLIIIGWAAPHGEWKDGAQAGEFDIDYNDDGTFESFQDDRPPDGSSDDSTGTPGTLSVYGEMIEDLSVRIGRINAQLDLASGNADHLAVFVGDNGVPTGGADAYCTASDGVKDTPYPCGTNTPLLFYGDVADGGASGNIEITGLFNMIDLPATLANLIGTHTTRSGTYSFADCITDGNSACLSRPFVMSHRYGDTMGGAVFGGGDTTPIGANPFPPKNGDLGAEWSYNTFGAFTDQCGGKTFFLRREYDTLGTMSSSEVCEDFHEVLSASPGDQYLVAANEIDSTTCSVPGNFGGEIDASAYTGDNKCAYDLLNVAIDKNHTSPEPKATFRGAGF